MSVVSAVRAQDQEKHLFRAALIDFCKLSDEAINAIDRAEHSLSLDFCTAALNLGYVTQADIDASRRSRQQVVVIEQRRSRPRSQLRLLRDPYDAHSEKVRALRTELLLRRQAHGEAEFVAVLSPCGGEGRSQLAAELAIAFSQLDQPTLLVDADLRQPKQHVLFGTDNDSGLSDAIVGNSDPQLHAVDGLPQLSLLTAGPLPSNPLELLSDGRFEEMVAEWRRSYAFVVLDTAPVERYSDGLAVAHLAGRVLALSRAQHTPDKQMRNMLRRLSATQSMILGAVINHF